MESTCKAACQIKCPPNGPKCELDKFDDETNEEYGSRCQTRLELIKF